jgi:hypothetical protein
MGQGPNLLFDKSTRESLNPDDAVWPDDFPLTNITRLCFPEALPDLEKQIENHVCVGTEIRQFQARQIKHLRARQNLSLWAAREGHGPTQMKDAESNGRRASDHACALERRESPEPHECPVPPLLVIFKSV